ncbi:MAG: hypothetical protein ACTHOK_08080 [Nocardioidaceae bacterium]
MKQPTRRTTRRQAVVLAAALAVAGVALGVGALQVHATDPGPDAAAQLADSPSHAVALDLGPASPASVKRCLSPDFGTDPAQISVVYGVRQRTGSGAAPAFVLRNAAGVTRLCDQYGGDFPAQAPAPVATRRHPVTFFSSGRRIWTCDGRTVDRFVTTEWLSTAPRVRSVRLRFVVGGRPGPWFTTRPQHGFAHLTGWLEGPVAHHTPMAVQQQVRDGHGRPVKQHVLPKRERLLGCAGGSAQIG